MDSAKKEAKEYLKENFPKDKCPCGCMKEVERELREEDEKEAFIADMADQDFVVSNLEGDSADVDEEYEERFLDAGGRICGLPPFLNKKSICFNSQNKFK